VTILNFHSHDEVEVSWKLEVAGTKAMLLTGTNSQIIQGHPSKSRRIFDYQTMPEITDLLSRSSL
jgi:hypothetical protein